MFERILVAADGSRPANAALAVAASLASAVGGSLLLVAVIEEPPPYVSARREELRERDDAGRYFEDQLRVASARLRRRGLSVATEVRVGNEVQMLLEAATRFDADLLVVGHAGHSGVWGTRLGATAARLLALSPISVLVARNPAATPAISKIIAGYDGSPGARRGLEAAIELAGELQARLVVAAPPELRDSRDSRFAVDTVLARSSRVADTALESIRSDPGRSLCDLAGDAEDTLLVVGSTGVTHPWSTAVGPTAAYVVEHAHTSVVVVAPASRALTAAQVMRRQVATVGSDVPLAEVVRRLVLLGVKTVPVTEGERLVGMVTLGDLMRRARLALRPGVVGVSEDAELAAALRRIVPGRMTSAEVMTPNPVTIGPAASIAQLLATMASHRVSRLPVVNPDGALLGIVSRADVLRVLAGADVHSDTGALVRAGGRVAEDVMRSEVAIVAEGHPLEATARLVLDSPDGRVAVTDEQGRVVGVIAVRDLLPLASAEERPRAVEALLAPAGRVESFLAGLRDHPQRRAAGDVMRRDIVTIGRLTPLADVLRLLVSRGLTSVLVTEPDGRLLGSVDRRQVIAALASTAPTGDAAYAPVPSWDASQMRPSHQPPPQERDRPPSAD